MLRTIEPAPSPRSAQARDREETRERGRRRTRLGDPDLGAVVVEARQVGAEALELDHLQRAALTGDVRKRHEDRLRPRELGLVDESSVGEHREDGGSWIAAEAQMSPWPGVTTGSCGRSAGSSSAIATR